MKRSASIGLFVALTACGGNVILDASTSASSGPGAGGGSGSGGAGGFGVTSGGGSSEFTAVSSSGVSSSGALPDAGPCGSTHLYADPGCESCAESSCCSELAACSVGTPCFEVIVCLANCTPGDASCQNDCAQMDAPGTSTFGELGTCFNQSCGTLPTCGTPTPAVCDSGLVVASSTACASCLTMACCPQAEACGQSAPCATCFNGHEPASCDPTYGTLVACKESFCADACP